LSIACGELDSGSTHAAAMLQVRINSLTKRNSSCPGVDLDHLRRFPFPSPLSVLAKRTYVRSTIWR